MSFILQTLVPHNYSPLGNTEKLCQQLTFAVQYVCTDRKQKKKSISFVLQDSWGLQMLVNVCVTQPNSFTKYKQSLGLTHKHDWRNPFF